MTRMVRGSGLGKTFDACVGVFRGCISTYFVVAYMATCMGVFLSCFHLHRSISYLQVRNTPMQMETTTKYCKHAYIRMEEFRTCLHASAWEHFVGLLAYICTRVGLLRSYLH